MVGAERHRRAKHAIGDFLDHSAVGFWQHVFGNTGTQNRRPRDIKHRVERSADFAIVVAGIQREAGNFLAPRPVRMAAWSQNDAFARDVPEKPGLGNAVGFSQSSIAMGTG